MSSLPGFDPKIVMEGYRAHESGMCHNPYQTIYEAEAWKAGWLEGLYSRMPDPLPPHVSYEEGEGYC